MRSQLHKITKCFLENRNKNFVNKQFQRQVIGLLFSSSLSKNFTKSPKSAAESQIYIFTKSNKRFAQNEVKMYVNVV